MRWLLPKSVTRRLSRRSCCSERHAAERHALAVQGRGLITWSYWPKTSEPAGVRSVDARRLAASSATRCHGQRPVGSCRCSSTWWRRSSGCASGRFAAFASFAIRRTADRGDVLAHQRDRARGRGVQRGSRGWRGRCPRARGRPLPWRRRCARPRADAPCESAPAAAPATSTANEIVVVTVSTCPVAGLAQAARGLAQLVEHGSPRCGGRPGPPR